MAVLARIKEHEPSIPVVMMTAHGNIDGAVEAMKSGASDFVTKPLDYEVVRALVDVAASDARARSASQTLDAQLQATNGVGLVGQTRAMRELQRLVHTIAASDASARRLSQLVDGGPHAARELVGGAGPVVVEEDHDRLHVRHVVMDGDDVDAVRAERLEHGRHLVLEHRDVARDHRVGVACPRTPPRYSGPCAR